MISWSGIAGNIFLGKIAYRGPEAFRQGRVGVRPIALDADGQCGRFRLQKNAASADDNLIDLTVWVEWAGQRGGNQQFMLVSMRSDRGMRWQAPGG